jgi:L-malate glycosyltransferase
VSRRRRVLLVWEQFGPYHMDRCEALASRLAATHEIIGVELSPIAGTYEWAPTGEGKSFRKVTLFTPAEYSRMAFTAGGVIRYVRALATFKADIVFLCNERPLLAGTAAAVLKLRGTRVITMTDSKYDDKPRDLTKELAKAIIYDLYDGAFVSGKRSLEYMRFHGFKNRPAACGYDTLSIRRVRSLAHVPPAPGGPQHSERHFTTISRFVPRKNLETLLRAFGRYRALTVGNARDLFLVGSGELEERLRRQVHEEQIPGVRFCGFLQEKEISWTLAHSLALVLPSKWGETWGLVVNEALAMGVPVLCSQNCGAGDLVKTAVNGYVFEPENVEGLSRLMLALASDESEWRRLAENARTLAPQGDVRRFVDGAVRLLVAMSDSDCDSRSWPS